MNFRGKNDTIFFVKTTLHFREIIFCTTGNTIHRKVSVIFVFFLHFDGIFLRLKNSVKSQLLKQTFFLLKTFFLDLGHIHGHFGNGSSSFYQIFEFVKTDFSIGVFVQVNDSFVDDLLQLLVIQIRAGHHF